MIDSTAQPAVVPARSAKRYWRFGLHNIRIGFRNWRRSRPFWGGFWSILGGAIVAVGPTLAIRVLFISGMTELEALLPGLLIMVFGLFLWFAPGQRHIVGILIEILAVASLVTSNIGGFLLGMIFSMTGGALGFAWVPAEPRVKKYRVRRVLRIPTPQPAAVELTGTSYDNVADLTGGAAVAGPDAARISNAGDSEAGAE